MEKAPTDESLNIDGRDHGTAQPESLQIFAPCAVPEGRRGSHEVRKVRESAILLQRWENIRLKLVTWKVVLSIA